MTDNNFIMDLHNHSKWSDGQNSIVEIIENAIVNNISHLGITDHNFSVESAFEEKENSYKKYLDEINTAAKSYEKSINIYSGIELCVLPYPSTLKSLPYNIINKFDYVLLEYIELLGKNIKLEELEANLKNIDCRIGLAHTDLYDLAKTYKDDGGLDYVLSFLKRNNIFWEINANSSRLKFDFFLYNPEDSITKTLYNKLKEEGIMVSAGSDTHWTKYFEGDRLKRANKIINDFGLQPVKF